MHPDSPKKLAVPPQIKPARLRKLIPPDIAFKFSSFDISVLFKINFLFVLFFIVIFQVKNKAIYK
ncbi:hypothetical protein D1816_02965 [Aquimarina sp. AD10]|uniref:Uncharacterized protein n=1 Tax=Aquimarina aggregata TaxID=1642818 RepID=A0A163CQA4_9FLAO|nr:hypothetical protein D1816_02965 [Aquimarina sp. AD10]KZS42653.1 hypothetical protein AWE51_04180 [Aquimarina aggregata]RKM91897.1 hypothetical protein D7033_21580 [Aquimarina sp. AD10]